MKKSFLLFIASIAMMAANAQSIIALQNLNHIPANIHSADLHVGARTTNTLYDYGEIMLNVASTDTPFIFVASQASTPTATAATDSGYLFGTSAFNITGFAERYDFNSTDSMVKVIGIYTGFTGTVQPASTNIVYFKCWNVAAPIVETSSLTYSGFPGNTADSTSAPYTQLGTSTVGGPDTFNAYFFADSGTVAYRTTSFFVGDSLSYTWGTNSDTLANLFSDYRHNAPWTITSGDTTVNCQSVLYWPLAGEWLDLGYDEPNINGDYFIFPIIDASKSSTLGVSGITNKNFTFFSNYPNPCVNSMNVKFSIAVNSDVTISITDMSGRVINTTKQTNLSAGEHIIPVATSDLAAGNYLCAIQVTAGGGIASKFTVLR